MKHCCKLWKDKKEIIVTQTGLLLWSCGACGEKLEEEKPKRELPEKIDIYSADKLSISTCIYKINEILNYLKLKETK